MISLKKKWPVAIAAAIVVVGTGIALAAWLLGGSGSAGAKVDSAQNLTAAPAEATTALYPGAEGDMAFTVSNPNPFAVKVTDATFGDATGCDVPAITVTGEVAETTIAAGGEETISVDITMGDSSTDCQGADLTIPVTSISAESVEG
jgi:hypothetical protein